MKFLFLLLSWLSGMLVILIFAFFTYEQFSIVDITSFAVFMLIGCILSLLFLYIPALWLFNKHVLNKKKIHFPMLLVFVANIPVYAIILWKNGDLYGSSETFLFILGFVVVAAVFGRYQALKVLGIRF
jgi:hypothetical protein